MRILCITNHLYGTDGWGRYSTDLIYSLSDIGNDIRILCHRKNTDIEFTQYEVLSSPISFSKNYLLSYFFVFKYILQIKKFNPDIIHCMVETYSPIAYLIALILRKKYIITVHGSFALKPFINPVYSILQKHFCAKAKHIVAVSQYTKKRLQDMLPNIPIVVINNGINESFLTIARKDISKSKEKTILGVGSVKNRKGFHISLKVFAEVLKEFPDYKYIIIGNTSDIKYVKYIKEIIRDLNIADNVEIIDDANDDRLIDFYSRAKLFVLTSVSDKYDFEGFGLVYIEANAFGTPVIGCYESGAEDAIVNGKTGFLVKSNDINDIVSKVFMVLRDDMLYNSMSSSARAYAVTMSWTEKVKEYIKLYL